MLGSASFWLYGCNNYICWHLSRFSYCPYLNRQTNPKTYKNRIYFRSICNTYIPYLTDCLLLTYLCLISNVKKQFSKERHITMHTNLALRLFGNLVQYTRNLQQKVRIFFILISWSAWCWFFQQHQSKGHWRW